MNKPICLVPRLRGLGGMVSFQAKLIQGLTERDIPYTFDLSQSEITAVLVIGGTRHLAQLWRAKKRGALVVQRLNGMNWMHKVTPAPIREHLRAEINNHILALIRRFIADRIVYQSEFSQTWWNRVYGERNLPTDIVYNGVDLARYTPNGSETPPEDRYRILLVEGHLTGAYARGLETAVKLALAVKNALDKPLELMIVGEVSEPIKAEVASLAGDLLINWHGVVPRQDIPAIDRSAHVLFSTDLNAACPNSVIEALACGLPVLAYDTGALAELVQAGAGEVVPYGADHWQLKDPQIEPLARACLKIFHENATYRMNARLQAEGAFSLDQMVEGYLAALEVR